MNLGEKPPKKSKSDVALCKKAIDRLSPLEKNATLIVNTAIVAMKKQPGGALHALRFVSGLVAAAVDQEVYRTAVAGLRHAATVTSLLKFSRDEIRRLASGGAPRSSSFLEGPILAERLRAWSEVKEIAEEVIVDGARAQKTKAP